MRIFWTTLFLLVPVVGVGALLAGAMSSGGWLPPNISTLGAEIDAMFYMVLAITGFFFVVTELLLCYAMFTARGVTADGKAQFSHGSKKLEVTWTTMTAAILLFIAFYQMSVWARAKYVSHKPINGDGTRRAPDAFITASQFLWQIRYPLWDEAAGKPKALNNVHPVLQDSFELINELHVPAGEKVLVHLTTRDVIHSFWLPNVRIKQDALPGHVIPVWFDATKPGEYEWVCAELCGWGHYRMRAKLIVHRDQADYHRWLQQESQRLAAGQVAAAPAEK